MANAFVGLLTLVIWADMARNEADCVMTVQRIREGVYSVQFRCADLVLYGLIDELQVEFVRDFLE